METSKFSPLMFKFHHSARNLFTLTKPKRRAWSLAILFKIIYGDLFNRKFIKKNEL